ncbi:MAG: homoserine kinase [Bacillales bacterium]|nr:homoserine kinase [Bacillales bacterium]
MSSSMTITVPASTANLGPGFDSIGLALSKYLNIQASVGDHWQFEHISPELKDLPNDESHFICQIAKKTAEMFKAAIPPLTIKMESNIPLARGLGSSAAAVAAAIELANQFCGLSLSSEEKLQIGTRMEGHPDNIGASIYGGLVIGVFDGVETKLVHISSLDVDIVAVIPSYELKTEEARKALPNVFERKKAVQASALSNVFLAALLTGDYELAGNVMEKDLFHEPYRIHLIDHFVEMRKCARENGAFGTAISGAGPAVLSFAEKGKGEKLAKSLQAQFLDCEIELLSVDQNGIQVSESTIHKDRLRS